VTVTGLPRGMAQSVNCTLPAAVAGVIVVMIVSVVAAAGGESVVTVICVDVGIACGMEVMAIPKGPELTGIGVPAVLVVRSIGVTVLVASLAT
jgi:hypothetical protein